MMHRLVEFGWPWLLLLAFWATMALLAWCGCLSWRTG